MKRLLKINQDNSVDTIIETNDPTFIPNVGSTYVDISFDNDILEQFRKDKSNLKYNIETKKIDITEEK